jgi:hypothetical protein
LQCRVVAYLSRVERIYPTRGRSRVKVKEKKVQVETEENSMKIEINEKTRMTRNRQVTGEKGWQLAGNRDLTSFLPRGGNYESRITWRREY